MVRFSRSVVIRVEAERVFNLVTDVARKARLNPRAEVIQVEKETSGPVSVGTVFHFVLRHSGQVIDYRSRCVAFEAGRTMETVSDTDPSFSVRVTVEPTPEGTRLTQEEWFDLPGPRPPPERKGFMGLLTQLATAVFGGSRTATGADDPQVQTRLEMQLDEWLQTIRAHLEGVQTSGSD